MTQIGERYGTRVVISEEYSIGGRRIVNVQCDCGWVAQVRVETLGKSKSAYGCKSCSAKTHGGSRSGGSRSSLYSVWASMMTRCNNRNCKSWKNYGGRGIKVAQEWGSYEVFRDWAKVNNYSKKLELDRIDNNKGYSAENCRFVTRKENGNNKRNTIIITAYGESKCLVAWADDSRCSVSSNTLWQRLRLGWSHLEAISTLLISGRRKRYVATVQISPSPVPVLGL